jgi:hypothetical protein
MGHLGVLRGNMKKVLLIVGAAIIGLILPLVPLFIIAANVVDFDSPDDVKVEKIHAYILQNYEPKDDYFGLDIWQPPLYTIVRGGGDCEDLAMLEWVLLRFSGVDASFVYGKLNGDGHIWVEYEGRILESTGLTPSIPEPGKALEVLIYQPIFHIGGSH